MLPSLVLSLREGLEAALILGIVLGAVNKMNRPDLKPAIWWGAAAAGLASMLAALALRAIGAEFEGTGEQIFEGTAMLLAAGVLTWMIFWMQRQSRSLKSDLEIDVQRAAQRGLQHGQGRALFALAFLAVGREGLELALFLFAAGLASDLMQTLAGAALGLAAAALLGWMLFASTRRLSLKRFFMVTNVLLILFAAGLVAHGVHEFNEAHIIPEVVEHVWDLNGILPEESGVGQVLAALLGYNGNPSLTEVLAYLLYFAALAVGLYRQPQLSAKAV
jgi:high-affinity iron transporter